MTLYKKELKIKADELKAGLKSKNIEVSYAEENFRDYLIMLEVKANGAKAGRLSLYYKPSKDTFSLKKQIKDKETEKIIDVIWDNLNGSETYNAESGIYEAFVDGSYISGVTGYGAVVYLGDKLLTEISGTVLDVEFRQFGGELKSVIETLKWCIDRRVEKVRINYDYQGIEKFATGEWKPKNSLSREYVDFIKNCKVSIEWRHIKSHTGNSKNDEADKLAKKAAMQVSSTVSKRFIELEKQALAFIDFINSKEHFEAHYLGAHDGEYVKIKIVNAPSKDSGVADMIYAKGNTITIRQSKSSIESAVYNLWQEFLFLQDFGA